MPPPGSARSGGTEIRLGVKMRINGGERVRFRSHGIVIRGAQASLLIGETPVQVGGEDAVRTSNRRGVIPIEDWLGALGPGIEATLRIEPAEGHLSDGPGGPDIGRTAVPAGRGTYDILWRPIEFTLEVDADGVVSRCDFTGPQAPERGPHANTLLVPAGRGSNIQHIDIDWKPDFLRRVRSGGNERVRPKEKRITGGQITHIVLHQTGGVDAPQPGDIGGAANRFTHPNEVVGIHYIVDVDGHVLKMLHETRATNHASASAWQGTRGINGRSIGIEHVHHESDRSFPDAQMRASVDLVQGLVDSLGVPADHLIGHGDVRCISNTRRNGRPSELEQMARNRSFNVNGRALQLSDLPLLHPDSRTRCPGVCFEWHRLEEAGIALAPSQGPIDLNDVYGGLFVIEPGLVMRPGDKDDDGEEDGNRFSRYGGRRMQRAPAGATAADAPNLVRDDVIRRIQEDLHEIGYANLRNGNYDWVMESTVKRFQARYFCGDRRRPEREREGTITTRSGATANTVGSDGRLDAETAAMLQRVLMTLRSAA